MKANKSAVRSMLLTKSTPTTITIFGQPALGFVIGDRAFCVAGAKGCKHKAVGKVVSGINHITHCSNPACRKAAETLAVQPDAQSSEWAKEIHFGRIADKRNLERQAQELARPFLSTREFCL